MSNTIIRSWSRVDFIQCLLGATSGAEIGVLEGASVEPLVRGCPDLKTMYLIDPWTYQPNWDDIANSPQEVQDLRYQLVKAKFPQWTVLRMTSEQAASIIPDGSLDFVFIDARHEAEYIKQDIDLWYPKLTQHGVLSGHDFDMYHPWLCNIVSEFGRQINRDVIIFDRDSIWAIEL